MIYENDSTDATADRLKKHQSSICHVISESGVAGPRTVRLARGRNLLLQHAIQLLAEYAWYIVMDMDFENEIDLRGIVNAVQSWNALRWNACTAVTERYYDFWALRVGGLMDYDCWADEEKVARFGDCTRVDGWQPRHIIWVQSAFNGLAIHRMEALRHAEGSYRGLTPTGKQTCEHVSFYQTLGRVIIHPDLVAQVWTTSHSKMKVMVLILALVVLTSNVAFGLVLGTKMYRGYRRYRQDFE